VRISPYLTSVNPTLDRLAAATDCGQAHWAGTGPEGATCGQCANANREEEKKMTKQMTPAEIEVVKQASPGLLQSRIRPSWSG
jgi:hypothetical protein